MTQEELFTTPNNRPPIDETLVILANSTDFEDHPDALDDIMFFVLKEMYHKGIDFEQLTENELYQLVDQRANELIVDKICQNLVQKGIIDPLIDEDGNVSYKVID